MNPVLADAIRFLATNGWQEIVPLVILAAVRPLGLLYFFVGFSWAMGRSRILHTGFAVGIGIPVLFINLGTVETMLDDNSTPQLLFAIVTELLIGGILGFIMSLPFFGLGFAGALTDQFRGESDSGLQTPGGGTITTWSLLYTVIGLFAFAYADGIALIFRALYHTYIIWPLMSGFPSFTAEAFGQTLQIMGVASLIGIRLGLPLFFLLVVIELTAYIGARVAKRFNFYNHAFLTKNLIALASLPLIGTYALLFFETQVMSFIQDITLLEFFDR